MDKKAKKTALANLRNARKRLADLPTSATETPEYTRRNDAVIAAEKQAPWWRR